MFLHTVKVCTNLKFWRLWHCCRCWSWRASGSHWEGGGHKGHCTQVEVQPESALNKCIEQEEEDKRSSCERGFRLAFPFSNTPLSPTPIFVFNLRCCLYVFSPVPRLPSLCLPCAFPFLHICQISHIVSLSQQNTLFANLSVAKCVLTEAVCSIFTQLVVWLVFTFCHHWYYLHKT